MDQSILHALIWEEEWVKAAETRSGVQEIECYNYNHVRPSKVTGQLPCIQPKKSRLSKACHGFFCNFGKGP